MEENYHGIKSGTITLRKSLHLWIPILSYIPKAFAGVNGQQYSILNTHQYTPAVHCVVSVHFIYK